MPLRWDARHRFGGIRTHDLPAEAGGYNQLSYGMLLQVPLRMSHKAPFHPSRAV